MWTTHFLNMRLEYYAWLPTGYGSATLELLEGDKATPKQFQGWLGHSHKQWFGHPLRVVQPLPNHSRVAKIPP